MGVNWLKFINRKKLVDRCCRGYGSYRIRTDCPIIVDSLVFLCTLSLSPFFLYLLFHSPILLFLPLSLSFSRSLLVSSWQEHWKKSNFVVADSFLANSARWLSAFLFYFYAGWRGHTSEKAEKRGNEASGK